MYIYAKKLNRKMVAYRITLNFHGEEYSVVTYKQIQGVSLFLLTFHLFVYILSLKIDRMITCFKNNLRSFIIIAINRCANLSSMIALIPVV